MRVPPVEASAASRLRSLALRDVPNRCSSTLFAWWSVADIRPNDRRGHKRHTAALCIQRESVERKRGGGRGGERFATTVAFIEPSTANGGRGRTLTLDDVDSNSRKGPDDEANGASLRDDDRPSRSPASVPSSSVVNDRVR